MSEQQTAPELSINDIAMAVRVIDVAAERGAYRGPELSSVGKVRDTLAGFVQANTPAQTEGEGESTEAPADQPAAAE